MLRQDSREYIAKTEIPDYAPIGKIGGVPAQQNIKIITVRIVVRGRDNLINV